MACVALLERNPNPSHAEIVESMDSVYCRCTGYTTMVAAIHDAASKVREG